MIPAEILDVAGRKKILKNNRKIPLSLDGRGLG